MKSIIQESMSPTNWDAAVTVSDAADATRTLESGRILLFKSLGFTLTPQEHRFLSPECADPRSKSIGYDSGRDGLQGTPLQGRDRQALTSVRRRWCGRSSNHDDPG